MKNGKKKGKGKGTKMNEGPSPKLLGTGMARGAAEALGGRGRSIDDIVSGAVSGKKKKSKGK